MLLPTLPVMPKCFAYLSRATRTLSFIPFLSYNFTSIVYVNTHVFQDVTLALTSFSNIFSCSPCSKHPHSGVQLEVAYWTCGSVDQVMSPKDPHELFYIFCRFTQKKSLLYAKLNYLLSILIKE